MSTVVLSEVRRIERESRQYHGPPGGSEGATPGNPAPGNFLTARRETEKQRDSQCEGNPQCWHADTENKPPRRMRDQRRSRHSNDAGDEEHRAGGKDE